MAARLSRKRRSLRAGQSAGTGQGDGGWGLGRRQGLNGARRFRGVGEGVAGPGEGGAARALVERGRGRGEKV